MTNIYRVWLPADGWDVLKAEDSIKAARLWAKRAFPDQTATVSRHIEVKRCPCCDSSPCCRSRRRAS